MGQTSSKPLDSKVFEGPEITVDTSLRAQLESSPETDVVRKLYTEKYIEDQVAKRLYDEQIAAENALKSKGSFIPELTDERLGGANSVAMREKVAELHRELTSRPLRGSLDDEAKKAREQLVECLSTHKTKPLACRLAFAEFQREVSRIENKIATQ